RLHARSRGNRTHRLLANQPLQRALSVEYALVLDVCGAESLGLVALRGDHLTGDDRRNKRGDAPLVGLHVEVDFLRLIQLLEAEERVENEVRLLLARREGANDAAQDASGE